jgi:hypothetical protein
MSTKFNRKTRKPETRVCLYCGKPFVVGPGGRRVDAKYCCADHAVAGGRRSSRRVPATTTPQPDGINKGGKT